MLKSTAQRQIKEALAGTDAMIDTLVNDLQKAGLEIARLRELLEKHGIKHD